jgi:hypothetical protein
MEYPMETQVIALPERQDARRAPIRRVKIDLTEPETASPRTAG